MTDNPQTSGESDEYELTSPEAISLRQFFETVPPEKSALVANPLSGPHVGLGHNLMLTEIELHCPTTPSCDGFRLFQPDQQAPAFTGHRYDRFVKFICRNCKKTVKVYAICFTCESQSQGTFYKYGEFPAFGPPTPSRVIKLIGPDKDLYLTGRRAENQGMGIGAFAYYRRVVEYQKNRMIDGMIRVVQKTATNSDVITELEMAKQEAQFSKAVGAVRHGLPDTLLINGHNPLTLLHTALSGGLHAQTDSECLELARTIRRVLVDLSDRIDNALKDRRKLDDAVSRLMEKPPRKE